MTMPNYYPSLQASGAAAAFTTPAPVPPAAKPPVGSQFGTSAMYASTQPGMPMIDMTAPTSGYIPVSFEVYTVMND